MICQECGKRTEFVARQRRKENITLLYRECPECKTSYDEMVRE